MLERRSYTDVKHFISFSEHPLNSIKNKTLLYQLKDARIYWFMLLAILTCISDFAVSQDFCISFNLLHQPPTWRTRVSLFVWVITINISGTGGPSNSYAIASVGYWIIWPRKPHRYVKVEIPSGGHIRFKYCYWFWIWMDCTSFVYVCIVIWIIFLSTSLLC